MSIKAIRHPKRQSTDVWLFVPKIVRAKCRIAYEVLPTGSGRLYRLKTVETMKGEVLDPKKVENLNPALDRSIAVAIHGEYALNELGFDPAIMKKKCKNKDKMADHPTLDF